MKERKVFLIYNAAAGKRKVSQELEPIITALTQKGCVVTAYPVLLEKPCEEILDKAYFLYDAVVCCGGDGTLHHTVDMMLHLPSNLPIGYLPFGSTNDFAASLGLKQSIEKNCETIAKFEPRPLDIGGFNEQSFCYVAAFGMFTDVSYETPQAAKNLWGHFAYIIEGMRRLNLSQGWKAVVHVDDRVLEGEFWYGSVSNATYIGGMAVPEQNSVQMDDGLFEVMLIRKPQTLIELHRLAASLLNQKSDNDLLYLYKARKIHFAFEQATAWTLDGEAGPEVKEATISVQEKRLQFLL